MRCAALSFLVILLGADSPQRALSQAAPRDQLDPATFTNCVVGLEGYANSRGISHATTDQQLKGLLPDSDVLLAVRNQPEFERPLWEHVDAAVSEARVNTGQGKLAEWAGLLDAVETRFGVDRHILVAIWGIESAFGAALEDPGLPPVVRSLATLACGDESRSAYWRDELMAALQILERPDVASDRMTGSWAGAMGHTQFMPTTYQKYAVDFDGDGKRDLWSASDALASTANYMSSLGWRKGERWGFEVELPTGFDYSLADETTERPIAEWTQLGVRLIDDQPPMSDRKGVLILPTGAHGPAFLLLPNFRIILSYNPALAYALSVAHLSDRLRGAPPFAHDWPRGDRMLTSAERKELQTWLATRGFELGPINGRIGPRTRAAIRAYQRAAGLPPDGYANAALLERVRTE